MDQYRVIELREVFIELFCTVKTAVDNPMVNPSGSGGRSAFLVLDEGELEGIFGYWAEDEEDGAAGFLDALEDVFWIWDENDHSWYQQRFQGRRTRKGKGRKGKGRQVDKVEDFSDLEPKEKEKGKDKEKASVQGMRATGLKVNGKEMRQRIGMRAIGPMKMKQRVCQADYYEYGYFQGKRKTGKKGK